MSDESLNTLHELLKSLEKNEIELLLPQQVEDEFIRNKNSVVNNEIILQKKKIIKKINLPPLLREKKNVERIDKLRGSLLKEHSLLIEKYRVRAISPRSRINVLIKKIFLCGKRLHDNEEIIERAYSRYYKGNPPRKNDGSLGDAIIWEHLLENVSKAPIYIITNDNDWCDPLKEREVNEYLKKEWMGNGGKTIVHYRTLGSFAKEHVSGFKKKPVKKEVLEEEIKLTGNGTVMFPGSLSIMSSGLMSAGITTTFPYVASGMTSSMAVSSPYLRSCSHCGKQYAALITIVDDGVCQECRDRGFGGMSMFRLGLK